MDAAPKLEVFLRQYVLIQPSSKCSSALTRLAKLVSPFQGCLKAVSPAVSRPPVVPHQPSRSPRHDQYEISGLKWRSLFNPDTQL
jgi:hypothetical protein